LEAFVEGGELFSKLLCGQFAAEMLSVKLVIAMEEVIIQVVLSEFLEEESVPYP
jgi:hypothetical protein